MFAGSGNPKLIIQILNSKKVPKEKYTILGYVDYQNLPTLYSQAFAYVMPTSWENLPFKLLEAMSSGLPVITTNVGGISEVVKDGYNGVFTSRTAHDVSKCITHLLENKYLAKKIGQNARKTIIEKFDWRKTVRETRDFYENTLCPPN